MYCLRIYIVSITSMDDFVKLFTGIFFIVWYWQSSDCGRVQVSQWSALRCFAEAGWPRFMARKTAPSDLTTIQYSASIENINKCFHLRFTLREGCCREIFCFNNKCKYARLMRDVPGVIIRIFLKEWVSESEWLVGFKKKTPTHLRGC